MWANWIIWFQIHQLHVCSPFDSNPSSINWNNYYVPVATVVPIPTSFCRVWPSGSHQVARAISKQLGEFIAIPNAFGTSGRWWWEYYGNLVFFPAILRHERFGNSDIPDWMCGWVWLCLRSYRIPAQQMINENQRRYCTVLPFEPAIFVYIRSYYLYWNNWNYPRHLWVWILAEC